MENCCKNFTDKELYLHQLKSHIDLGARCNICGDSVSSVMHHIKRKHKKEFSDEKNVKSLYTLNENHKCRYCDFSSIKQYLTRHVKNIHVSVEKIKCSKCDDVLKPSAMYFHMLSLHSIETYKYKCDVCEIEFKHGHTYKNHLKTESHDLLVKAKSVKKSDVDEKFKERFEEKFGRNPRPKIKTENDKGFKCDECDKSYASNDSLKRHKKNHSPPEFNCSECGLKFHRKDHHKRHMKERHNPVYVKCSECDQYYSERELKNRHLKICIKKKLGGITPGISKNERIMFEFLRNNNIKFSKEKRFPDLKNFRFDFYLQDHNTILEIHGQQHYKQYKHFGGIEKFNKTVCNDKVKKDYCQLHDINYICIDSRQFEVDFNKFKNRFQVKQ